LSHEFLATNLAPDPNLGGAESSVASWNPFGYFPIETSKNNAFVFTKACNGEEICLCLGHEQVKTNRIGYRSISIPLPEDIDKFLISSFVESVGNSSAIVGVIWRDNMGKQIGRNQYVFASVKENMGQTYSKILDKPGGAESAEIILLNFFTDLGSGYACVDNLLFIPIHIPYADIQK